MGPERLREGFFAAGQSQKYSETNTAVLSPCTHTAVAAAAAAAAAAAGASSMHAAPWEGEYFILNLL